MQDSPSIRSQDLRERDREQDKANANHKSPIRFIVSNPGDQKIQPSMFCCKLSLRRREKLTQRLMTAMLILSLVILVSLHLVILPSASGGYNDECYLTDQKRQNLRIMQNISRVYGVQYWDRP